MEVYLKVNQRPHGYLTLDLHPASNDNRCMFSHILTHEGCMRLYQNHHRHAHIVRETFVLLNDHHDR